ncbi:TPA: EamA family transporter [Candidatus Woesearchaeota archaeon]|nr:EamA family transporter [Candidatus Woesearchaeota archaeon]HII69175.1 EamA family transporter [Candidatus Woesearchaeota archaeon]
MSTALWAIGLVIVGTLVGSWGSLFFKIGSKHLHRDFKDIWKAYHLLLGFMFYGFGSLLFMIALPYGELSVLYPFVSLSYVWISFMSLIILKEEMTSIKWIGIAIIILGIVFIGAGM